MGSFNYLEEYNSLIAITRSSARQFTDVRLITDGGNEVVTVIQALAQAEEFGLDLVVVSPKANPPVVRIQDLKKLLYEQKKAKAKQTKGSDLKEIQLKVNISDHDLTTKINSINRFLERGDKVKITIRLKGRERENPERAHLLLGKVTTQVKEAKFSRIEGPITGGIFESSK